VVPKSVSIISSEYKFESLFPNLLFDFTRTLSSSWKCMSCLVLFNLVRRLFVTESMVFLYFIVARSINSTVSLIPLSIFKHRAIFASVLWYLSSCSFDVLWCGAALTICMLNWLLRRDLIVSDLIEGSLSQYIVFVRR